MEWCLIKQGDDFVIHTCIYLLRNTTTIETAAVPTDISTALNEFYTSFHRACDYTIIIKILKVFVITGTS
jgi:hypothetical protein